MEGENLVDTGEKSCASLQTLAMLASSRSKEGLTNLVVELLDT